MIVGRPRLEPVDDAAPQARPAVSSASVWGPRFLAAVLAGVAACVAVGMGTALSALTMAALAMLLLGAGQPVVAALAMTCGAVLDGPAADTLQPTLAAFTGGLWRYNTIGYALGLVALAGLPSVLARRDVHTRLALALGGVMAVGLLWSPDRAHGLQLLLDVVAYFGLLFVFARIADDRECWDWIGMVGGTLGAGAGLVYAINVGHMRYTNPNVAVFVPLTGMMAVCLAFGGGTRRPARQAQLGLLAVVNLLWAFLSTSRGGLLTGVACLAFIAFQLRGGRQRLLVLGSTVAVGLLLTSMFAPLQHTAIQRFSLLFDRNSGLEARTSGRSELVVGSWEIFQTHPFGVGTGGFETAWSTLGSVGGQRRFIRAGEKFAAHAGWMRVLAENGFVGFAVLAAFVASFAVAGLGRRQPTARHLGLLAAVGLGLALVTSEFHLKGLFFVAAGVAALLDVLPRLRGRAAPFRHRLRHSVHGDPRKDVR